MIIILLGLASERKGERATGVCTPDPHEVKAGAFLRYPALGIQLCRLDLGCSETASFLGLQKP